MKNAVISPFVKWAGGKRQLMPQIKERMPIKYNKYYEPFVGGGAVVFGLLPQNALVNDINKALMNTYCQIKDNTNKFLKILNEIDNRERAEEKEYYYTMRNLYNQKLKGYEYDIELAALFVYLNKHCFNGLYRVNSKGLFNVPYNNKISGSYNEISIRATAKYLKTIKITVGDFEKACCTAEKGDFIFFDSPYAPLKPTSFEAYTKEGFSLEDHIRLAKLYDDLTARGCYCMLTNHNTKLITDLYSNKGYTIDIVSVRRMINSDASNRKGTEVIICNY